MSVGVEKGRTRKSGRTAADEVANEEGDELLADIEAASLDVERKRTFSALSFSRMRTDWSEEQSPVIIRMHEAVSDAMLERFPEAYQVMTEIFDTVRDVEVDEETGEVKVDAHGFPIWKRSYTGGYQEDWTRLTLRQKEHFLFSITTNLWAWQQAAADLWGEAMMAKSVWQESFSRNFDYHEGRSTVDARTARGNVESAEDRYFAVYVSLLSRKADALCRSMELIGQRLRDTIDR